MLIISYGVIWLPQSYVSEGKKDRFKSCYFLLIFWSEPPYSFYYCFQMTSTVRDNGIISVTEFFC